MKKNLFNLALVLLSLFSVLVVTVPAHAQLDTSGRTVAQAEDTTPNRPSLEDLGGSRGGITNPAIGNLGSSPTRAASGSIFVGYIILIWRAIITVGGLTVLLMFVWGAVEWITAGGDTSKIEKARNRMTQAVIGMIVLTASFTIIGFISTLFFPTFNLLELTFPTP